MEENSDSQGLKPVKKKLLCKYCQQKINEKAQVCHLCGRDQRRWINRLQYLATTTAFIMVLVVSVQAYIGYIQNEQSKAQTEEAKKKRVEAQDVLVKAKHVFTLASSNSNDMKVKSSIVLKRAEDTVQLTNVMSAKAESEIMKTRLEFQDLAVSLTEPVATALAFQSEIIYGLSLEDKIIQSEKIIVKLRRLGVPEDKINIAIEPLVTVIRYKYIRRILFLINEALPVDNKISTDAKEVTSNRWNLDRINKTLRENAIKPKGELQKLILDLEYYEKNKKLKR